MPSETLRKAFEIRDYLTTVKRRLHSRPELGMAEFETTEFVARELDSMGIERVPLSEPVGVLGILEGTGEGEVVALRADMDALPIQETADVPDRSVVPGVMHACGHDAHTAMLLGAAKLLASMRSRFSGTVKFLFQPAEETLGGSDYLIGQGALENPKVNCILGLHGHSGFDVGEVALRPGSSMASSDFFTATLVGASGHGAYPHRVVGDAVLAAANAVTAIQSIVTRQIDAVDSIVISICEIHGGTAKNVIPDRVSFGGSVRCQTPKTRNTIEERLREVVRSVAAAYRCGMELDYCYGVPPLVNSPRMVESVSRSAARALGAERVRSIDVPAMGSEDFSRYLERVPEGVFARLGIRTPGKTPPPFHNGAFVFPEEALPYGTALFVQFVLDMNGV